MMAAWRSTSPCRSSTTARAGTCARACEAVLADLAGSGLAHRVLVLDNASGDDLSELAERAPRGRVLDRRAQPRLRRRPQPAGGAARRGRAAGPEPRRARSSSRRRSRGCLRALRGDGGVAAVGPAAASRPPAPSICATTASCAASARGSRSAAGHSHYRPPRRAGRRRLGVRRGVPASRARGSTPSAASTPASSSTRRRRTCSCASGARAGGCCYLPTVRVAPRRRARSPRARSTSAPSVGALRRQAHPLPRQRRLMPAVHRAVAAGAGGSTGCCGH